MKISGGFRSKSQAAAHNVLKCVYNHGEILAATRNVINKTAKVGDASQQCSIQRL